MSCFNPAHFEQIAINKTYQQGPCNPSYHEVKGPMNWELLPQPDGNTGIFYETHWDFSNEPVELEYEKAMRDSRILMPLEERYYLHIDLNYFGYAPAHHSINAMNQIRDQILKTIKLTPSESAKKQLSQSKAKWPNAKASTNRKPKDWIYPEWRDGTKGEDHIIITKAGSPRPEFTP